MQLQQRQHDKKTVAVQKALVENLAGTAPKLQCVNAWHRQAHGRGKVKVTELGSRRWVQRKGQREQQTVGRAQARREGTAHTGHQVWG